MRILPAAVSTCAVLATLTVASCSASHETPESGPQVTLTSEAPAKPTFDENAPQVKPSTLSTRRTAPKTVAGSPMPITLNFDPCGLLTSEEVAATTREPLVPGVVAHETGAGPTGCNWGTEEGSTAVSLAQFEAESHMGEAAVVADIDGREVFLMFGNQARCLMYTYFSDNRLVSMDVKAHVGDGRSPDDLCNQSLSLLTTAVGRLNWE
ncbi:DUF3558 family protein [Prescottella agglutinans]|uniref:DUF3558 domain-containing protein n=1 Tax=Prescottella agglutinans TaxID=1644129 RepID=A0ABT6MIP7_9NOCA|nr:DUF3558 family protein [Prescottella agglutinans]MDH6283671.1 hypothetical protein [Prescottella agglutinans]